MKRLGRNFILTALAILAAGCGGGGSNPAGPDVSTIGEDRIVAVTEQNGQLRLVSYTHSGADRIVHATLDPNSRVLDVAPNGQYLLVSRPNAEDLEELYLTRLDGITEAEVLTEGNFLAIETARFSPDGTRIVCAGLDSGGKQVVGVADMNDNVSIIRDEVYTADFLADGRLAVAGQVPAEEGGGINSALGVVNADGSGFVETGSAPGIVHSLDAAGSRFVVAVSASGDENPATIIASITTEGEVENLTDDDAVYQDPRLSPDGALAYIVRSGTGIVRIPAEGGAQTTLVPEPDVVSLVTVR